MKILQIVPAQPGWNVVYRTGARKWSPGHDEAGGIEFVPVACWALVEDGAGTSRVLPMGGDERGAKLIVHDPDGKLALGISPPGRRPRDWVGRLKDSGHSTRRIKPSAKKPTTAELEEKRARRQRKKQAEEERRAGGGAQVAAPVAIEPNPDALTVPTGWKLQQEAARAVAAAEDARVARELEGADEIRAVPTVTEVIRADPVPPSSSDISLEEVLHDSTSSPDEVPGGDVLDLDF